MSQQLVYKDRDVPLKKNSKEEKRKSKKLTTVKQTESLGNPAPQRKGSINNGHALAKAKHIEKPTDARHLIHVVHDPETGEFLGLPPEWKTLLNDNKFTDEEINKNSDELVDILSSSERQSSKTPQAGLNLWDFIELEVDPSLLYDTQTTVGEGFGGIVYLCKDKKTSEQVAIKKVELTSANESSLASEIYMMKTCTHPNIVEFKCSYFYSTRVWIVMEFMDGGTLGDLLDFHSIVQLTETQIRWIIFSVCKGLKYLHKKDRIHRDIKSDNVLLSSTGEIKIGDFGFVAQLEGKSKKRRTRLGTPYWMAPEIIKGKKYDYTADVWSLGILMYECAQGDPPYYNLPKLKALLSISKYGCPPLTNPEAWSADFKDFMKICLKKNPAKRADTLQLLQHPWLTNVPDLNTNRLVSVIRSIQEKLKQVQDSKKLKAPRNLASAPGSYLPLNSTTPPHTNSAPLPHHVPSNSSPPAIPLAQNSPLNPLPSNLPPSNPPPQNTPPPSHPQPPAMLNPPPPNSPPPPPNLQHRGSRNFLGYSTEGDILQQNNLEGRLEGSHDGENNVT